MDENAPPGGTEKPKKESGIAALINSPAGVTMLGFFLTGVLGALVSFSVNAFQRWDQEQTQTLTERENEISSVNKQFVGAIVQRTFYTDAVLAAIGQSKAGSDLDAAWPRYESAYQAELAAVWQNHLNIEGHLEDDPAPTGNNGWQPFWAYLDLVIQPRYQEWISACAPSMALICQPAARRRSGSRWRNAFLRAARRTTTGIIWATRRKPRWRCGTISRRVSKVSPIIWM